MRVKSGIWQEGKTFSSLLQSTWLRPNPWPWVWVLCFCCLSPVMGQTQGGLGSFGSGSGNNTGSTFGNNNPFATRLDTAGGDSADVPEIEPETRWVSPRLMFTHAPYQPLTEPVLGRLHYWDQLDLVPGFVQSLGQTGKPYQVLLGGVEERFWQRSEWRDPFFERYNRYVLDPATGVRFFDTKTPYVRVDYSQTNARTVITSATITQNVTPRLNFALFIKRQLSEGVYREFVTDHTQLWASSNYRSKNKRYRLFSSFAANFLNDEINGGVPRDAETEFALQNGEYLDLTTPYNSSFFGGLASPLLSDAQLRQSVLGAVVDQYYHLIGHEDSASRHRLTLRGMIRLERNQRRFVDENITSILNTQLYPIYPTLAPDSIDIYEGFRNSHGQVLASASYTWSPKPVIRAHVDGGIRYQIIGVSKENSSVVTQNLTETFANGEIRFPWLALQGRLRQRLSTRLSPEQAISVHATLYPFQRKGEDRDTANAPFRLKGLARLQNLNPSLFQAYFVGDSGNVFVPGVDFSNQTLTLFQGGAEWVGGQRIREGDTLLPMYFSAAAYLHRIDRQIYYDSALRVQQAPAGAPMQWLGVNVQGRFRLWRHFFIETDTRLQIGTVDSQDASRTWIARSMPLVYGRTSFYADYRQVNWAEQARFGVDVTYRTDYLAQAVDPVSGEFFPTNYLNIPYAQVDVFAALRLRGVYVFFKYQHLNEQLLVAGYYTTPFYPMWGRAFVLGVNWPFFN